MNEIIRLNAETKNMWEEYVKNNPDSGIQHSLKFMQVLKESYSNCEEYYFLYKKDNIRALFPFVLVKSKIFGDRLICIPFLDVGGFLGLYDSKILNNLIKTMTKDIKNIRHIEVRLNTSLENFDKTRKILLETGFKEEKNKYQFIIPLTSKEDMWERFHKHTRNDIRKAQKSGLKIEKIDNKEELKRFYGLYSKEMRNFGTPQHSYKFFEGLFDIMGSDFIGFNCYYQGDIAGSLIAYNYNNHAYISFNVSNPKFRDYRPNDFLYWTAITLLMERGVKNIDMGQVEKDSPAGSHAHGLYKFKAKWLGELHERLYFYLSKENGETKEDKNRYKRFRNIWKHLPLFVIKKIGPKICSELGT